MNAMLLQLFAQVLAMVALIVCGYNGWWVPFWVVFAVSLAFLILKFLISMTDHPEQG